MLYTNYYDFDFDIDEYHDDIEERQYEEELDNKSRANDMREEIF